MTGRQFARVLRLLPREELDAEIGELVDRYDRRTCRDCGRHHPNVWAALACDGYVDARRRAAAARVGRQIRRAAEEQLSLDDAPPQRLVALVNTGRYV